jgi:hypothetical protein
LKKKKSKKKSKKKPGQPSSYDPIYCQMLIDHRARGHSFKSFAAKCNPPVCPKTLYNWKDEHPEFLRAMEIAYPMALLYWEERAINGLHNETIKSDDGMTVTRSVNAQVLKLMVMNLFPDDFRDRKELSGDKERPIEVKVQDDMGKQVEEAFKLLMQMRGDR